MQDSNTRPIDCYTTLQPTELRGKLTIIVHGRTSHNGGVPFILKAEDYS